MTRATTKTQAPAATKAAATSGLASLTPAAIAAQTDEGSFSRGKGYARGGYLFNLTRRGATIRCESHGQSGGPYRVEATLATTEQRAGPNPLSYDCDCPRGGFCKHVVALLLVWIEHPETFEVRQPVSDVLASKSREELIALIELMVEEEPDLESLLALPAPVTGAPGAEPVDEAALRRQIAAAFRDDGSGRRRGRRGDYHDYDDDEYEAAGRIAGSLQRLVTLADGYLRSGQWGNALRVASTLVDEVVPQLDSIQDDEGDLAAIVIECDRILAACLDAQAGLAEVERLPAADRARLIEVLFGLWQSDLDTEVGDLSQEGPSAIARAATPEEQQQIAGKLRAIIDPAQSGDHHQQWVNRAALGFLSMLPGDAGLSEEELADEYRKAELWDEAAYALVRSGRVEEAIALAARRLTAANVLLRFADHLVVTGDPVRLTQAINLVDSRLWEQEGRNVHDDSALREWLETQYVANGFPAKALELVRQRFRARPAKHLYDAVKAIATLPEQPNTPWRELRVELIETLTQQGRWAELVEIHLDEERVDEALSALKKAESGRGQVGVLGNWIAPGDTLTARVATAAERDYPDEAVRLYRRLADKMIESRQRTYYQAAAGFLARVKHVLVESGRAERWQAIIGDLRQQHKTLRALREELDKLGLV